MAGHTVHGMPQIGEITPGLWLLSGFGGHGLNTTAMGGEMIARAIVEGDRAWQMFSPFALVWAGGALGRAAQQVSDWSHRTRDAVEELLARRRNAKRRRVDAAKAAPAAAASPLLMTPAEPAVEPVAEPIAAMEPRWLRSRRRRRRHQKSSPAAAAAPISTSRLHRSAEAAEAWPEKEDLHSLPSETCRRAAKCRGGAAGRSESAPCQRVCRQRLRAARMSRVSGLLAAP